MAVGVHCAVADIAVPRFIGPQEQPVVTKSPAERHGTAKSGIPMRLRGDGNLSKVRQRKIHTASKRDMMLRSRQMEGGESPNAECYAMLEAVPSGKLLSRFLAVGNSYDVTRRVFLP